MGFIQDLGRSKAISRTVGDLSELASEQEGRRIEEVKLGLLQEQEGRQTKLDEIKINKAVREEKQFNRAVPISAFKRFFKVPGAYDYAVKLAEDLNYLDTANPIEPTILDGYSKDILERFKEPIHAQNLSNIRTSHWKKLRDDTEQQLIEAQGKGKEKDVLKLQQQYNQFNENYIVAMGDNDNLLKWVKAQGKGTELTFAEKEGLKQEHKKEFAEFKNKLPAGPKETRQADNDARRALVTLMGGTSKMQPDGGFAFSFSSDNENLGELAMEFLDDYRRLDVNSRATAAKRKAEKLLSELPDPLTYEEGTVVKDDVTGLQFKVVNGGWERK